MHLSSTDSGFTGMDLSSGTQLSAQRQGSDTARMMTPSPVPGAKAVCNAKVSRECRLHISTDSSITTRFDPVTSLLWPTLPPHGTRNAFSQVWVRRLELARMFIRCYDNWPQVPRGKKSNCVHVRLESHPTMPYCMPAYDQSRTFCALHPCRCIERHH